MSGVYCSTLSSSLTHLNAVQQSIQTLFSLRWRPPCPARKGNRLPRVLYLDSIGCMWTHMLTKLNTLVQFLHAPRAKYFARYVPVMGTLFNRCLHPRVFVCTHITTAEGDRHHKVTCRIPPLPTLPLVESLETRLHERENPLTHS